MSNLKPSEAFNHVGSLQLIHALNAIATTLQESILNEDNVYSVFQREVVNLGLRGGISELSVC